MVLGPVSPKQAKILQNESQILVCGGAAGSGKSYLLNMIPLKYVDCPYFTGIIFRRETGQLKGLGGLWQTARDIYGQLPKGSQPHLREGYLDATWANGAKVKYNHMEHAKDRFSHQGLQYTFIGFDEGTHFEFEQVEYLMSRMRSQSKYPSRMVISCNPDPDHFLYDWVEWYLQEDGLPDPEKDGVERYFIRRGGNFIWADTKEELIQKYSTPKREARPISFTFISAVIYDNPVCLRENESYVDFLEGLNETERQRLLLGNWKVRAKGVNYFKREDLQKADKIPVDATCCRAWDKASQIPTEKEQFPDFTASIKLYKNSSGEYFISGEYHHDNKDDWEDNLYGFFRAKPGKRDNIILKQALFDGADCCPQVLPQDPGSAGHTEFIESAKKLAQHGVIVKKDPVAPNKSKLQKFSPVSAAIENGLVYIVESTFPNKKTLEYFYKQLESFDGETRSSRHNKDEAVDILATAYNYLSKAIHIPKFTLPQSGINNRIVKLKSQVAL